MSIELGTGSIFDSEAEVLVNPVNCVGVMGAGLAKEFKKRFPEYYSEYVQACRDGRMRLGIPLLQKTDYIPWVISFPTKDHWRNSSKYRTIMQGMLRMVSLVYPAPPGVKLAHSVAIPALGCGLGGLKWSTVRDIIEEACEDAPGIRWILYKPQ